MTGSPIDEPGGHPRSVCGRGYGVPGSYVPPAAGPAQAAATQAGEPARDGRAAGFSTADVAEAIRRLTLAELSAAIWKARDEGASEGDIRDAADQAVDSWVPPFRDEPAAGFSTEPPSTPSS